MALKTKKSRTPTSPKNGRKHKKSSHVLLRNACVSLLIFTVFVFVWQYGYLDKLSLNGDNASYYLLGKSINLGKGYCLYNDINCQPHNHFPPGYPVIIAILMLVSKSTFWLKLANGGFLLGSLFLSYKLFRKLQASWQLALVTVLVLTFNYHLVKSSVIIMSEIPFLFFSLLSLWLLLRIDFSEKFWKSRNFYFLLFSLSFSFHIRTAGIALLAGVIFYLIIEKKWKASALVVAGFFTLATPWFLRGKILSLPSSYQNQLLKINPYRPELGEAGFIDFANRFANNLTRYITKEIPSGILPFLELNYKETEDWSGWIIGSTLACLIILAIFKLLKYRPLIIGYLGGTFAILMLWPDVWFGTRFILPLLPILIFLTLYAINWILKKLMTRAKLNPTLISFCPFLLLPIVLLYTQEHKPNQDDKWQSYPITRLKGEAKFPHSKKWENYIKVAEYAKKNLNKGEIIACRKPQLFHIYSDNFTSMYPFEDDDKKFLEILTERNVKYIVVEQLGYSSTGKYLVPAINNNKRRFKKILHLKNPDTYLLEFLPLKKQLIR